MVEAELDETESGLNGNPDGDGIVMGVESGSETPGANGGDGLFVQALAQSFDDADFLRAAVDADEDADGDVALEFQFAGFFGVGRLRTVSANDG